MRGLKDRAKMAFEYADEKSRGSLSKREYKIAMTAIFGYRPDKAGVKEIFSCQDRITYEEFEKCACKKGVASDLCVNAEILFSLLDKNYKGYLVLDDFYSASESVDLKVSPLVWRLVFKGLDCHKKRRIEYNEFLYAFSRI